MKSKDKAAKQREHNRRQKLQEQQANDARVLGLKNMTSGFARTARTKEVEAAFAASKIPVYSKTRTVVHSQSLAERFTAPAPKPKQQLSEEMQQREAAAREQYEEMKKRVGPAYNKGGYQYLSEGELAAEKKGELRRRS
jgi:hypothetical protein